MVWHKDLAKLKQELKTEETTGSKPSVPKPAPKPTAPRALGEEDALFLAAMGGRRKAGPLAPDGRLEEPPAPLPPPEQGNFTEAMATLKGMKPVGGSRLPAPSAPTPPRVAEPEPPPPGPLQPPPVEAAVQPSPAPWTPPLIQLAAGMAIEVDGSLDLRGHSPMDGMERLKERLLDGHLLGWRTVHVQLGNSEDLRQALLDFLAGPEAGLIARYAQAPIPMGGAQSWILYLGLQGPSTR